MTCAVLSAVYAGFYVLCAGARGRARRGFALMYAAQLAISFFNSAIHDLYALKTVIHFAVSVAVLTLVFRTRPLRSALLVGLCFAGQILAEMMAMTVYLALDPVFPYLTGGAAINLSVCVFNAAVVLSIGATVRSVSLEFSKKELAAVSLLSLLFFAIEFSFLMVMSSPAVFESRGEVRVFLTAGVLICFAADTLALQLTVRCARARTVELQNAVLEKQCERQRVHYEDFAEYRAQTRAMRHDIANYLAAIKRMVSEGEARRAESFTGELADRYAETSAIDCCENNLVDAVLHEKIALAQQGGVEVSVDVRVGDGVAVDDVTLASVFCNLIDNALEAALAFKEERGGEAVVETTAEQTPSALAVKTQNPCAETDTEKRRADRGAPHGTGALILDAAAKRYGGVYERRIEDGVCTACVMLPLPSGRGDPKDPV